MKNFARTVLTMVLAVVLVTPLMAQDGKKKKKRKQRPREVPTFTNKHFEAPILLTVGNVPLNKAAGQMYPSPAVYDVDNDGDVELVVGDISGRIYVYENKNNTGKGDPLWSSHAALKTAKGENIRVSNW